MENFKHTPGPFGTRSAILSNGHGEIEITAETDRGLIWVGCAYGSHVGPIDKNEVLANVALFTAAPDMLEALIGLVEIMTDMEANFANDYHDHELHSPTEKARAAIQKATQTI